MSASTTSTGSTTPNAASALDQHSSWLWLVAATLCLVFADGRYTVQAASWLALIGLLRFARLQPAVRGLFAIYLALTFAHTIAWRGMVQIKGIAYFGFFLATSLAEVLPYVADRLLYPKLRPTVHAFVFPAALVTLQWLLSYGPQGTWGAMAYTQADNLPLLQSLAVFGLWWIPFLIGWCATSANLLLQHGIGSSAARKLAYAFIAAYLLTVVIGGARLAMSPVISPTVRVAALSPSQRDERRLEQLIAAIRQHEVDGPAVEEFDSSAARTRDELLARSEREAAAGAKIVFWSEGAVTLRKQHEAELLRAGRQIAARNKIYLGVSAAVWDERRARPLENKLVLIAPDGAVAFEYLKTHPTLGLEWDSAVAGPGRLPLVRTPFGKLSAAICYDTDFPALIAQAGAQGADIVLSPADDWREIDPRHTTMARFRAIEQGVNLVRSASDGLSAAYDYQGRTLAAIHDADGAGRDLIAHVPMRGVRTIYSRVGDVFAWCCALALGALWVSAVATRRPRA
ncbi:MAG TPA: nitrilase-related carbon-nitrogen hydrolase [Steroidobacteraceae bacterium]|nr:nitrilase-related carbon-nitrogen hydrolase [Steroidobacteraceae bacterium]